LSNSKEIPLELGQRVADSPLRKGAGIEWPRAVDRRLDQLKELAESAGERTTRSELAAAIVCETTPDAARLRESLTRYRTATGREVLLEVPDEATVISLPVHRSGPRAARS
jgi:hypothetical protein